MPTSSPHFKDEIQAMLDHQLDASKQAEVERHLETCGECQRELASLRWAKQVVASQIENAKAPADLRQKILLSIRSDKPPKNVEPLPQPASFWRENFRSALAWAAVIMVVLVLGTVKLLKQPGLPEVVARDFREYQSQKLALELNTGAVKDMEAFFTTHGIAFDTRVFDLGMMNYTLLGGRIQRFQNQPAALFVYQGVAGQILHCRMYAGKTADLPAGALEREHNGIKFHIYQTGGMTLVFWQEGKVVCALASDISKEELVQLAFAKAMLPG